MRSTLVAANWKMNMTVVEARLFLSEALVPLSSIYNVEKVICPPFTSLAIVSSMLSDTDIGLGAQNMYWEENGAYTGEVSPNMISEFCRYVILGHSERRELFHETDEVVNKKIRVALAHNIIPIVCIGETLEEHSSGLASSVVSRQLAECFRKIRVDLAESIVVAYEPIWAIGNGHAAYGQNVNQIISEIIRPTLAQIFGIKTAQAIRVLYGGSVTGANAAEFFAQSDIDGALVGGASLKVDEFVAITRAAAK